MSIAARPTGAVVLPVREGEDPRGEGWVSFAAAMLTLGGIMSLIDGIAAASGSHFFTRHVSYLIGDLGSLGWALIVVGVVQVLAGVGVLARNQPARWVGTGAAAANGSVQLLAMPSYPFWSLAMFAVDIAVIYGLVAYGQRVLRPA